MRPQRYGVTTDVDGNVLIGDREDPDLKVNVGGPLITDDDVVFTLGAGSDQALVNQSTLLAANTALTNVLEGTPVCTAIPANSLVVSNRTASGDIVLATLLGGTNSTEAFRVDTSAGLMIVNEASADWDFRVETDGMAFAVYSDGGKNALVLGSNTDTSSADQLITVSRAARTATASTSYYDLRVAPAGAVTVPTGTTAVVATVSLVEPNVTATGTVTRAATLHIASQPTEGGTANAAILFGAAANIAGTTSLTINDDSEDLDFRVEADGIAYALYVDGGKNALVLGSNTDTSSVDQLITVSRAARTATASTAYYDLVIAPAGAVSTSGTTPTVASLALNEPLITKVSGTITNATTLYIASQPTEGDTTNSAIFFGAAANIAGTTSITFNEDSADIDFRFESNDNANMLVIDGGLNAIGIGGAVVSGNTLTVTNSAVAATGRIVKLSATLAAAALTDGYGAFEVDVTLSGSPTDHSAAASAWVNITGGTVPVGTYICARNDGVYEAAAATITNAKIVFGARMQKLLDDTDALSFPFSVNTNNTAITALIDVNNITDLGTVANAGASAATLLPILRNAAGTLKYVLLYDLA